MLGVHVWSTCETSSGGRAGVEELIPAKFCAALFNLPGLDPLQYDARECSIGRNVSDEQSAGPVRLRHGYKHVHRVFRHAITLFKLDRVRFARKEAESNFSTQNLGPDFHNQPGGIGRVVN